MSDQPILVSASPEYVLQRTDTPARGGRGWRHTRRRLKAGSAKAFWVWPGEAERYRTRADALRAGRSSRLFDDLVES